MTAPGRAFGNPRGSRRVGEPTSARLVLRLKRGGSLLLGPGKVELLERIERTGSISAAARGMRMSYRQAWLLVDAMNRSFRGGVVETVHGGSKGGGARLTPTGRLVVQRFRALERRAEARLARELASLRRLLERP